MRETRLSGSEGGGVANTRSPHPYLYALYAASSAGSILRPTSDSGRYTGHCENSAGADLQVCEVIENTHLKVCVSPSKLRLFDSLTTFS